MALNLSNWVLEGYLKKISFQGSAWLGIVVLVKNSKFFFDYYFLPSYLTFIAG